MTFGRRICLRARVLLRDQRPTVRRRHGGLGLKANIVVGRRRQKMRCPSLWTQR